MGFRNREAAVNTASGSGGGGKSTNGFRLTLTTAVPVTTTDVTGATTIYLTPYVSDEMALFDGAATWTVRTSVESSLALGTLTSGKNYDVFAYWTGTAIGLELSAAWTSDTARSDAVTLQNGVAVKSAATTRRLVGTIRTTSTTATEDSAAKRFVANLYNRQPRPMSVVEATASWTYATAAWRQANAAAANKLQYVACDDTGSFVEAEVRVMTQQNGAGSGFAVGVGVDRTSDNDAQSGWFGASPNGVWTLASPRYRGAPGLGFHALNWLEYSVGGATSTFYGSQAGSISSRSSSHGGITGTVWA